ncbi:putative serine hydrolase-like [Tropilaelaps mercedesae]|uniref:Putative serine hydrolase-like n=1 Tax=Tropilaelaps mercedesae TaxID=418985 RepID=A0A1V9XWI2_9ACAR|nr:putative serine hydrolase-like [Tropilaelaps mercedesae]
MTLGHVCYSESLSKCCIFSRIEVDSQKSHSLPRILKTEIFISESCSKFARMAARFLASFRGQSARATSNAAPLIQKPPGVQTITTYKDQWTCQEIRIPTPCGALAAKAWGPIHAKPILALHGWQDNANTYDLLIPLLKPKYRIIALDFVGHGYSSHLAPGLFYSTNNFIMDIERVAHYFAWDSFIIMGHSMGGGIGHMYSLLFPERLRTLVTIDVPLPATMTTDKFVMMTAFSILNLLRIEREHFGEKPFAYTADEIIKKHMAAIKNAYTREAVKILMRRGCTQVGPDQFIFNRDRRLKYVFWNSFDANTAGELATRYKNELLAIRCVPMQFYKEGYHKIQEIHRDNCSRYQYSEIEGLHHIHMTDPEKVAPIINEFLDNANIG